MSSALTEAAETSHDGPTPSLPLSAAQRIPPELFFKIVGCLQALIWGLGDEPLADPHSWIYVTQVSQWWRQMALNEPTLWTTIYGMERRMGLVQMFLDRSGDLPLSVVASYTSVESLRHLLHMTTPRPISSLTIIVVSGPDSAEIQELEELAGVREFKIVTSSSRFGRRHALPPQAQSPFIRDVSNLETLSFVDARWTYPENQEFPALRHLSFVQTKAGADSYILSVRGLLSCLRNMPHLETLRIITNDGQMFCWFPSDDDEDDEEPEEEGQKIHLANLRSLDVGLDDCIDWFCEQVSFPSTTRVAVSMAHFETMQDWEETPPLLTGPIHKLSLPAARYASRIDQVAREMLYTHFEATEEVHFTNWSLVGILSILVARRDGRMPFPKMRALVVELGPYELDVGLWTIFKLMVKQRQARSALQEVFLIPAERFTACEPVDVEGVLTYRI